MSLTKLERSPQEELAAIEAEASNWIRGLDRGGAVSTDELIHVLHLIIRVAAEARCLIPNP